MDQTSELTMQELGNLYDNDQDYEQDAKNQDDDLYDQNNEEEPNENEYFAAPRWIEDDWYNSFEINQVLKDKDMDKRRTILEKLGFQPKTCWHCFQEGGDHKWANGRTRSIGPSCANGSKCGSCSKQITWSDSHSPTIDCPKLSKTKSEVLAKIKECAKVTKTASK